MKLLVLLLLLAVFCFALSEVIQDRGRGKGDKCYVSFISKCYYFYVKIFYIILFLCKNSVINPGKTVSTQCVIKN